MPNFALRNGISWFMTVAVFITIWVIMILFVEWDGSKPGGWGWLLAGFTTIVSSVVAAWLVRIISRIILVDLAKKTEEANIERERRARIREENEQARRKIANYKPT